MTNPTQLTAHQTQVSRQNTGTYEIGLFNPPDRASRGATVSLAVTDTQYDAATGTLTAAIPAALYHQDMPEGDYLVGVRPVRETPAEWAYDAAVHHLVFEPTSLTDVHAS